MLYDNLWLMDLAAAITFIASVVIAVIMMAATRMRERERERENESHNLFVRLNT